MAQDKGTITLKLTPDQQEQVRKATGKVSDTLEFSIMEQRAAHAGLQDLLIGSRLGILRPARS